ncbi:hypothetical protein L2E82_16007 [Cichorium intybus]|uniref:Uncharacterized protein n=1 Tax=Cichorium intybus TaxID=13427 RepID=A0ACB9F4C8_CICIN|nr:hypothetical protein L2E82_16007 [Cichorium intybus]
MICLEKVKGGYLAPTYLSLVRLLRTSDTVSIDVNTRLSSTSSTLRPIGVDARKSAGSISRSPRKVNWRSNEFSERTLASNSMLV